jgi:alpha-galactosidase
LTGPAFHRVAELPVDPARGTVYAHGWQSWSPTGCYPVAGTAARPASPNMQTMCYRPGRPAPERGLQGEGLLAVNPGDGGPVHLFAAADPLRQAPSIRAALSGDRLLVTADDPAAVAASTVEGVSGRPVARWPPGTDWSTVDDDLVRALAGWADSLARRAAVGPVRPAPTVWCSWYQYYTAVTGADMLENLDAIGAADLPVDVVQIDDGWQAGIGDWLATSDRFGSLPGLVGRIRAAGRRAGIWIAPFLVGARSALAAEHPEWLVGGAGAGHNWGQDLYALDTTHPGSAGYLREVFAALAGAGIDYIKADFCYAAALAGRRAEPVGGLAAYRAGMRLLRQAIGPQPYLLASGAPVLPSVGLVDAMRVAPDIAAEIEPAGGDLSRPSQRAATLSTVGRAFQHGRFWVNDPDCLIARPAVAQRERWAATVERYGGLRASSDRIADLDGWGLRTTRRLLGSVPPPRPFPL